MASKIEVEIELKTPAEKMWKNIKEFTTILPKALPHLFEKIDVIKGDGRSVGTVFVATLKQTESKPVTTITERIEMVDEEKKILSYSYVEGEILKHYKNYKGTICVISSSKSDGTLLKYTAEFEKANAQVPDPDFVRDFATKMYQDLDAYVLKA